jgi:hypothetical protein
MGNGFAQDQITLYIGHHTGIFHLDMWIDNVLQPRFAWPSFPIPSFSWFHVALVLDQLNAAPTLYINGVVHVAIQISGGDLNRPTAVASNGFARIPRKFMYLGWAIQNTSASFDGMMMDVRFINGNLSNTDVYSIFVGAETTSWNVAGGGLTYGVCPLNPYAPTDLSNNFFRPSQGSSSFIFFFFLEFF